MFGTKLVGFGYRAGYHRLPGQILALRPGFFENNLRCASTSSGLWLPQAQTVSFPRIITFIFGLDIFKHIIYILTFYYELFQIKYLKLECNICKKKHQIHLTEYKQHE